MSSEIRKAAGHGAPGLDAQALAKAFGTSCLRKAIDGARLTSLRQAIGAVMKDGAVEPATLSEAQALATDLTAQLLRESCDARSPLPLRARLSQAVADTAAGVVSVEATMISEAQDILAMVRQA